jgi:AraC-like DNA-binding protein
MGEMSGYVMRGNWVAPLIRAIETYGISASQLLAEEVSDEEIEHVVHTELGYDAISRLWRRAAMLTRDPAIGIVAAQHIGPSSFGPLSFAMYSSRNAVMALKTYATYSQFGTNVSVWWFHETDEHVELTRYGRSGTGAQELKDAVPAAILNMCKSLGDPSLKPDRLVLSRSRPADTTKWRAFFGVEPVFQEGGRTCMRFPLEAASRPCPSYEPELYQLSVSLLERKIKEFREASFVGLVRAQIIKAIETRAVHIDNIANELGLSRRTLQRRLFAEGHTTFGELYRSIRHSMAKRYLADSRKQIGEISEILCYASVSSFCRGFRASVGMTPLDYRRRGRELGER